MASADGGRSVDNVADNAAVQCGPCRHGGVDKVANTFCRQCDEYLCADCKALHQGLRLLRAHTLDSVDSGRTLDSVDSGSYTRPVQSRPPTDSKLGLCDEHEDKDIRWFCKKHEVMFCDTCKRIGHRTCEIMPISDMTVASAHVQELAEVIASTTALKYRIGNLKNAREKSVEDLEKLKQSLEEEVKQFKTRLIETVERLERNMLDELNRALTEEMEAIQDHIETCDCLLPKVEMELNVADEAKSVDKHVINVIAAYRLSHTLKLLQPTVSDIENDVYIVNITFQPSTSLIHVTTDVDRLGTFVTDRTPTADVDRVYVDRTLKAGVDTATIDRTPTADVDTTITTAGPVRPGSDRKSWCDMDVESSADIYVPRGYYTGVAVMPDGQVVLVDNINSKVIILDRHLTVQSTLALPSKPWDVAADGASDIIISMRDARRLQWLGVTPGLSIGRSIPIGKYQSCGLTVHGGYIYLSCYRRKSRGGGHVQVLDRDGTMVRRFKVYSTGRGVLSLPEYVAVSARGDVYVADKGTGRITCYSNGGVEMYNGTPSDMGKPCGLVVDGDCPIVCCQVSNNIQVLGRDVVRRKVMLSSADGVAKPTAVAYRQTDNTLIVTMGGTTNVRIYKLK